jgi:hypothetical protein
MERYYEKVIGNKVLVKAKLEHEPPRCRHQ